MQPTAHLVTVIRHAVCVGRTPEIIRPKVRVAHLDEVLLLHLPLISEDVVDRPPGIRVDLHGFPLLVREHRLALQRLCERWIVQLDARTRLVRPYLDPSQAELELPLLVRRCVRSGRGVRVLPPPVESPVVVRVVPQGILPVHASSELIEHLLADGVDDRRDLHARSIVRRSGRACQG